MKINQLSSLDEIETNDLLVVYQEKNQDPRKGSIGLLLEFIESNLPLNSDFASQYSSPITGATVQITNGSDSVHLILSPAGTLATLTIVLPSVASVVDKQEILVTSTQVLTALTISINGASNILGAPTTLSAGGFFRLKYDANQSSWNRIG